MAIQFNSSGVGSVSLSASTTGNWSLTLPTALSAGGNFLTTNGAGVLGFTAPSYATLTGFIVTLNTASPNNIINVSSLAGSDASTDLGIAIVPKLSGNLLACIPDNTIVGGNNREGPGVDLQFPSQRNSATQVNGGYMSALLGGFGNELSRSASLGRPFQGVIAGGYGNTIGFPCNNTFIGGGYGNTISNPTTSTPLCLAILGGRANLITSTTANSVVGLGGRGGTNHGTQYVAFHSGGNFGQDAIKGCTQTRFQVVFGSPTSTTFVDMVTSGAASAVTTTILPEGYVMYVKGITSGFKTTTLGLANWNTSALFRRATGGNITLVGQTVTAKGSTGTVTNFLVQWVANTTFQTGILQSRADAAVVNYSAFLNIKDVKAPF